MGGAARDGKLLWKRDAAPCHFNCPPAFLTEDGTVLVVASDSVPATIQALNSSEWQEGRGGGKAERPDWVAAGL